MAELKFSLQMIMDIKSNLLPTLEHLVISLLRILIQGLILQNIGFQTLHGDSVNISDTIKGDEFKLCSEGYERHRILGTVILS